MCVYVEICEGGLPKAGKCQRSGPKILEPHGYAPSTDITASLWKHKTGPMTFSLLVKDFAIKCTNKDDAAHLLTSLENFYVCSTDWDPKRFCGLTIKWE